MLAILSYYLQKLTKITATRALWATIIVSAALAYCAYEIITSIEMSHVDPKRLPFYELYLGIFKVILAGFVVAMLGILVPAVASEARYSFEKMKESRVAYSKAKTGVDYLKLRLSLANFAEAITLVQDAHFQKHLAELYDEFKIHVIRRYGPGITPDDWDVMMYRKLFRTRQILEREAEKWDSLKPVERIKLLDVALPTKPETDLLKKTALDKIEHSPEAES